MAATSLNIFTIWKVLNKTHGLPKVIAPYWLQLKFDNLNLKERGEFFELPRVCVIKVFKL